MFGVPVDERVREPTVTQLRDSESTATPGGNGYSNSRAIQPPLRGYAKLLIGMGLGIAIALIGSRLLGGNSESADDAPPPEAATQVSAQTVSVSPVQLGQVTDRLMVTGTVEAADLLAVTPRVGGLSVQAVMVEEGDRVEAGQPLVTLDDTDLRTQMQQAEAQIEVAQAQLQQQRANLAQAQATLAEAETNLQRYQSLADQGAVSGEELDRRATAAVTARESVGVARANIASAEATVRSRQSELARLQTQLTYTTVRAPSAGIVAERPASVGNVSSTSTPVVSLIRGNQLELVAEVPQVQLTQVQVGAPVNITASTDAALQLAGTVAEIQPLVDPQTRTARVIVRLPENDRARSGMFLTATIQTGQRSGLTIPAPALLPQPDGSIRVFVLSSDGTAVARTVEVGSRLEATGETPAQVEILQGLEVGEQVIVAGASYVQDGDGVTVAD